jgi:hypothetical protein
MGSLFLPRPAWTTIFLFMLPCIAGMTDMTHHTWRMD